MSFVVDVEDEPIFLEVESVHLPCGFVLLEAFVRCLDGVSHLRLERIQRVLDGIEARGNALASQLASNGVRHMYDISQNKTKQNKTYSGESSRVRRTSPTPPPNRRRKKGGEPEPEMLNPNRRIPITTTQIPRGDFLLGRRPSLPSSQEIRPKKRAPKSVVSCRVVVGWRRRYRSSYLVQYLILVPYYTGN